eukprot:8258614-Pyramimonas_sp.AAC.1
MKAAKTYVQYIVNPTQSELQDLRGRVQALKTSGSSTPGLGKEQLYLLSAMGPAEKQIAFAGFTAS